MSEKTYINGLFVKKKPTQYGEIVSVSIKADTLAEELQKHRNSSGYVNITFFDRKEADKNGNNMYAVLDTFEPKAKSNGQAIENKDTTDDLPF